MIGEKRFLFISVKINFSVKRDSFPFFFPLFASHAKKKDSSQIESKLFKENHAEKLKEEEEEEIFFFSIILKMSVLK